MDDLPKGLAKPAQRALAGAGITDLAQLAKFSEAEVRKLHGIGPKGLRLIRDAMTERGLAFAGEEGPHTGTSENTSAPEQSNPASDESVYDSPVQWVNSHIHEYIESNGEQGHHWRGMSTLLLTTTGRKTGKLRRTALIYGQDGACYVIVASNGGSTTHPQWYLNLVANPSVSIQVGAETFTAHATTAPPELQERLWPLMIKIFPQYQKYREATAREIPIVVLEPIRK